MGHYDEQRGKAFCCRAIIRETLKEVLDDVMQVFDFGAKKHPDSGAKPNFLMEDGNKCSLKERGKSILGHAASSFEKPLALDSESNLPHLLHLISSAAILYIRAKRGIVHPEDADRLPGTTTPHAYESEVNKLLKNDYDVHLVSGLAAEAGEVCGIFQKASYKNTPVDKAHLKEELGDVLFYTTAISNKYHFSLDDLFAANIAKLKERHKK